MGLSEENRICLECRRCCEDLLIETAYRNSDADAAAFYRARGFKVSKGEAGRLVFEMTLPCPRLGEDGCSIYSRRPRVCRRYTGEDDYGRGCGLAEWRRGRNPSRRKRGSTG
ncbi:MAG: hypothetical protein Kow0025_24450 [Thermodesulfovibrionales bacterium]